MSKELEPEQIDFIEANYLQMSIKEIADTLGCKFHRVRTYMKKNNLEVDSKTITQFRMNSTAKNTKKTMIDFWNYSVNPITMYFVNSNR